MVLAFANCAHAHAPAAAAAACGMLKCSCAAEKSFRGEIGKRLIDVRKKYSQIQAGRQSGFLLIRVIIESFLVIEVLLLESFLSQGLGRRGKVHIEFFILHVHRAETITATPTRSIVNKIGAPIPTHCASREGILNLHEAFFPC